MKKGKTTRRYHGGRGPKVHPKKVKKLARAFVDSGGNKTAALRAVGDSDPNAHSTRVFASPQVQHVVAQLLNESGPLSDPSLVKKLEKLIDARKRVRLKDKLVKVEDNAVQLSTTELVAKLKGWLGRGENIVQVTQNFVGTVVEAGKLFVPKDQMPAFLRWIGNNLPGVE